MTFKDEIPVFIGSEFIGLPPVVTRKRNKAITTRDVQTAMAWRKSKPCPSWDIIAAELSCSSSGLKRAVSRYCEARA
jgi:hypothetical protein